MNNAPSLKPLQLLLRDICQIATKNYNVDQFHLEGVLRFIKSYKKKGVENLLDYLELILNDPNEFRIFISNATIHTTHWFREINHFNFFEQSVTSQFKNNFFDSQQINVLSAACSTGEELYSAGLILEYLKKIYSNLDYQLFGNDIDLHSINHAIGATYPADMQDKIPSKFRENVKVLDDKLMVPASIINRSRFICSNLIDQNINATEKFDYIFCRNVLIYFKNRDIEDLISYLVKLAKRKAYLILGSSEHFFFKHPHLFPLGNSIYFINKEKKSESPDLGTSIIIVNFDQSTANKISSMVTGDFDVNVVVTSFNQFLIQVHELHPSTLILFNIDNASSQIRQQFVNFAGKFGHMAFIGVYKYMNALDQDTTELLTSGMRDFISLDSILCKKEAFYSKLDRFSGLNRRKNFGLAQKPLKRKPKLVLIGASTGGVVAIKSLLSNLPPDFPPIVVIQHILPKFAESFALSIEKVSGKKLVTENGELLKDHVYIPTDSKHFIVEEDKSKLAIKKINEPTDVSHIPSIDVLFKSVAECHIAKNTLVFLLTGMGGDGAKGMLNLHNSGGRTFAESEESCTVFGMPKKAIEIGAAQTVADISSLNSMLIDEIKNYAMK